MKPWPYPFWIAHRGAGKLAPENTLAAFRLGARHGYRFFECDVKLSADGVPFLLHDDTLERTTDGVGIAGNKPWAELSRLDAGGWHSRAYVGEPPATFAAVARFLIRNGLLLDLEIKPTKGEEAATGRAVALAVRELWAGQAVPPLLSSFRPDALFAAREAAPELPLALLLDSVWDGWAKVAEALGCVAVITDQVLMDAALLAQIKTGSRRALCYTVNDDAEAQRLIALGIDGLCTDAIDRFSPA